MRTVRERASMSCQVSDSRVVAALQTGPPKKNVVDSRELVARQHRRRMKRFLLSLRHVSCRSQTGHALSISLHTSSVNATAATGRELD